MSYQTGPSLLLPVEVTERIAKDLRDYSAILRRSGAVSAGEDVRRRHHQLTHTPPVAVEELLQTLTEDIYTVDPDDLADLLPRLDRLAAAARLQVETARRQADEAKAKIRQTVGAEAVVL